MFVSTLVVNKDEYYRHTSLGAIDGICNVCEIEWVCEQVSIGFRCVGSKVPHPDYCTKCGRSSGHLRSLVDELYNGDCRLPVWLFGTMYTMAATAYNDMMPMNFASARLDLSWYILDSFIAITQRKTTNTIYCRCRLAMPYVPVRTGIGLILGDVWNTFIFGTGVRHSWFSRTETHAKRAQCLFPSTVK